MITITHSWHSETIDQTADLRKVFEDHYSRYTKHREIWDVIKYYESLGQQIIFSKKPNPFADEWDIYTAQLEEKTQDRSIKDLMIDRIEDAVTDSFEHCYSEEELADKMEKMVELAMNPEHNLFDQIRYADIIFKVKKIIQQYYIKWS
jgi:hypothetical protein